MGPRTARWACNASSCRSCRQPGLLQLAGAAYLPQHSDQLASMHTPSLQAGKRRGRGCLAALLALHLVAACWLVLRGAKRLRGGAGSDTAAPNLIL